jgi:hypothetical protein
MVAYWHIIKVELRQVCEVYNSTDIFVVKESDKGNYAAFETNWFSYEDKDSLSRKVFSMAIRRSTILFLKFYQDWPDEFGGIGWYFLVRCELWRRKQRLRMCWRLCPDQDRGGTSQGERRMFSETVFLKKVAFLIKKNSYAKYSCNYILMFLPRSQRKYVNWYSCVALTEKYSLCFKNKCEDDDTKFTAQTHTIVENL